MVILIGEKSEVTAKKERCMGIDLGLENMATVIYKHWYDSDSN